MKSLQMNYMYVDIMYNSKYLMEILILILLLRCSVGTLIEEKRCNVSLSVNGTGDDLDSVCRWNYDGLDNIVIKPALNTWQCELQPSQVEYKWELHNMMSDDWRNEPFKTYDTEMLNISSSELPFDLYAVNLTVDLTIGISVVTLNKMGFIVISCWPYDSGTASCLEPQTTLRARNSSVTLQDSVHCNMVSFKGTITDMKYLSSYIWRFYLYEINNSSWRDAKEFCEGRNDTLAKVDSQEKFDIVKDFIQTNRKTTRRAFWIGGNYDTVDKEFKWWDGEKILWTNWYDGELNNVNIDSYIPQHCIKLQKNTFQFRKSDCCNHYNALCESKVTLVKSDLSDQKTPTFVNIRCLSNCEDKVNPGEKIRFHAECSGCLPKLTQYHWKHWSCINSCDALINETSGIDYTYFSIEMIGTSNIPRNLISVTVTLANGTKGNDEYEVILNDPPTLGNCNILPGIGYALLTSFNITCTGFTDIDLPLEYHVNQIIPETGLLSNLYIGNSSDMTSLYLIDGPMSSNYTYNLTVAVQDKYGFQVTTDIKVQVYPPYGMDSDILTVLSGFLSPEGATSSIVGDLISSGNTGGALNLLNVISTSLNTDSTGTTNSSRNEQKMQIRETIVSDLSTMSVTSVSDIEQISSVLNTVTSVQSELNTQTQDKASDIYGNMANVLQNQVNATKASAVENTAGILLNGVTKLLDISMDIGNQELNKVASINDHRNVKDDKSTVIDEQKQYQVKNATKKILNVVETVTDTVLDVLSPDGEPSMFVTDTMNIAVSKSPPSQLIGKSLMNQRQSSAGAFHFPNNSHLEQSLSNATRVGLQVIFTEKNLFTWDISAKNITSPVLNIKLKDQQKQNIEVNNLVEPVEILLSTKDFPSNTSTQNISINLQFNGAGNMSLYRSNQSIIMLRMSASVHRRVIITAIVLNLTVPLKILSKDAERPGVEEIVEFGSDLNNSNNFTNFLPVSNVDKDIFIGIIISDENNTLEKLKMFSEENGFLKTACSDDACIEETEIILTVQFDTYSAACMYWDEALNKWSTTGCQVSERTSADFLYCLCNHLTALSGSFFVLPNFIDPFADAKLFLTFFENPVVVSIAIMIWCVYFFLIYWARNADKKDIEKVGVNAVMDNSLEDKYTYLVCIITGWWNDAGTTANVSIVLTGTIGHSSRHALNRNGSDRKHFQSGSEDWFVITTPNTLGDLQSVTVWHDNGGYSPAWNLTRIIVEDLQTKESWTFLFGDWLAVDRGIFTTTVNLPVCTQEELKLLHKQNFMLKSSQDLRNGHLWLSIFSKPPHSTFTRAQRLTCALSLLLTTMLTNIMFHGIPTDNPEDQKTIGHITFSLADIIIGIESALIMFPINIIIVQLFMKTRAKPLMSDALKKNIKRAKDNRLMTIEKSTKLPNSPTRLLPWWFIYIAWTVAMTTSLVSTYFVMLYGLKFGYQKSVDFILSFLTSFFQSAFLSQPLKVVIIAVLITLILKKPVELESRKTSVVQVRDEPEVKEDDEVKMHYIPLPLTKKLIETAKEKLRIEGLVQETLVNISLYFVFVCIMLFMVHGHRNIRESYLCTKAIEDIFIHPSHIEDTETLAIDEITTLPLLWLYMENTIIPNLSEMNSENGSDISPNSNHFLVGYYRLRQLRVSGTCDIKETALNYYLIDMECIPPYSMGNEEIHAYNKSWSLLVSKSDDGLSNIDEWTFQSAWTLQTVPYMGNHGTYGGGGYIAEFTPDKTTALDKLNTLSSSMWLDKKTRGVFLEFTLFNPNVNLFSIVMILFEFTSIGQVFPFYQIFTSKLYHYSNEFEKFVSACEIFFLLFNLVFTYIEFKRLRKYGRRVYFREFWNCVEILQICLSYSVIGLFFQRMVSINRIIEEYNQSNNSKFVNFYTVIYWDFILLCSIAFLVLIVILKFFKLLKFNKKMYILSDTLRFADKSLRSFIFIICLLVLAFSHFGLLMFGSNMMDYSTLYNSFITLFNFALCNSDFEGLVQANKIMGPLFYFTFIFGVVLTFLTLFIAIINFAISESKQNQKRLKNDLEVVDYIYDKLFLIIRSYGNKTS